ncbi:MAG: NOB1 family endonuclease [Acidilobus sp.]
MNASTPACSAIGDKEVAVLDTGALIAGLQLRLPMPCFTTPLVVDEVKDEESRELLERSIEVGKLRVVDPERQYLEAASGAARIAGTLSRLSRADLSVVALALEFAGCRKRVIVASDDYSVQLTCLRAGVEVLPVRYRGVKEARSRRP